MKKILIALIPIILGVGCIIAYNIIGASVTAEGLVVEPFFLMPIALLLIVVGIIWLIVAAVSFFRDHKKSNK
jgi:hypothetical protein